MDQVDGIPEFPIVLSFNNNQVVCQALPHPHSHTCICLITPEDARMKTLVINATNIFGLRLQCGVEYGNSMDGFNTGMRSSMMDLGKDRGNLAIQFRKPNIFGIETDYGTLTLPDTLKGHVIVFFWPNDAPGNY